MAFHFYYEILHLMKLVVDVDVQFRFFNVDTSGLANALYSRPI